MAGWRPLTGALAPAVAVFAMALLGRPEAALADRSFDVAMAGPAIDPYGMVVVDRARTPQRFEFGVQAAFGWAHQPFRVTLADPQMALSDQQFSLIQNQLTVDLGFYFGLWDWLSIAAVMPMGVNFYDDSAIGEPIVPQTPGPKNPTGFPGTSGLYNNQPRQTIGISTAGARDPRFAVKARFYGGRYFEIGTILEMTAPLGDKNSFFGEKSVTFRPRLVTGLLLGRVNVALSFGAIVRESSELFDPYLPMNLRYQLAHELTWGAGIGLFAHRVLSLGIESFGTIPIAGDATSATVTMLGSLSLRPVEKWRVILAGGGGLLADNPRNADGRILLSLAYSLWPREGGLR